MSQGTITKRRYTEEEIERGLVVLALCGGNHRKAAVQLAEQGHDMPADTLKSWKHITRTQRYEEVRQRVLPRIQQTIAAEAEDLAIQYADVERATLMAFVGAVDGLSAKDAAGAIRNLATAKAINLDKAQLLRGNPTQIVEKRSSEQAIEELKRIAPHLAQPIDAEVVSEEVVSAPAPRSRC